MEFHYADLPAKPNSAFPKTTILKRPMIALLLQYGSKSFLTEAIVDSGADFCVFPSSVAKFLGVPIPNRRSTNFSGTADATQIAYFATVQATLLSSRNGKEETTFPLYAGFCDSLEHVGIGLLGQNGFFSRFRVAFDLKANSLTIE